MKKKKDDSVKYRFLVSCNECGEVFKTIRKPKRCEICEGEDIYVEDVVDEELDLEGVE